MNNRSRISSTKRTSFASMVLYPLAICCLIGFVFMAQTASARQSPVAEAIFINGKILTLDDLGSVVEAVAVQDGKVLATGNSDEIRTHADSTTEVIDLMGRTVMPGIVDSHTHASLLMRVRNDYVDIHFSTAPDLTAVRKALAERASETPKGDWIFAVGSGASAQHWPEKRLPTKAELDDVTTDHPIILLAGMHVAILNSKALEVLKIQPGEEYQYGSHIYLDEQGFPTGRVGELVGIFPDLLYDEETLKRNLTERIPDWFLKWGVTTVADTGVPVPNYFGYRDLAASGVNAPLRLTFKVTYDSTGRMLPQIDLSGLTMPPEVDHDFWRLAGIKIWADGEGGANPATAYISGHYHGRPGDRGLINSSQEDLNKAVARVHKAGLGMFIHASGDEAQKMVLDAHEYTQNAYGRGDTPLVLEHFGVIMGNSETFERAAKLGAFGVIQPFWLSSFPANTISQLGQDRAEKVSFHFKDMIEAGLEPAYGSDQTGSQRGDHDTMFSIELMITRRTAEGDLFLPDQALSIEDALRVMTIWSARSLGEGNIKGSLEAGKFADMVVLSENIVEIAKDDPEKISDIKVLETIIGGKTVYRLAQ